MRKIISQRDRKIEERARGEERRLRREDKQEASRLKQEQINIASGPPTRRRVWTARDSENRRRKIEADLRREHTLITTQGVVLRISERPTDRVTVSSPTVPGSIDFVRRPADALEKLRNTKPPKIDSHEYKAGMTYRSSWDTVNGGIGGVMDFDRVRGAGGASRALTEAEVDAARKLREADKLGRDAADMLEMILGHGQSVEENATQRYGIITKSGRCSRWRREQTERELIEALRKLVIIWFDGSKPEHSNKRDSIRAWIAP